MRFQDKINILLELSKIIIATGVVIGRERTGAVYTTCIEIGYRDIFENGSTVM